jgi:tol-pal system protein YbgF
MIFSPRYLFAACALCLASIAQAGLFDDDEARKAILELRGKVEQQNKDLAAKQTELGARTELLEQSSRGILQLQNQIQVLRDEIAKLRGQLELQSNDTANLQKLVRDQKDVIAANENRIIATETRLKQFEPVTAQLDGKQISVDVSEKKRYDSAIAMVRAGDFKSALTSLTQFQAAYPDSAYAASVSYWIGNSHYATKDYKSAITAFQSYLTSYADHPRVADAQFTLGLAQIESGDRKTGRRTLEIISERFPDTPLSQSAKERLATLKP